MEVNLEWYRVFYWIAKTGSLSRAAEQLHITQPAVSHTIKQLESTLGGQLFFRTPRGVTLTTEGSVLLQYIEQAFHSVEIGEKAIAEMNNLNSGEITIGASDTLCKHYLLPYLEQFHKEHPGIPNSDNESNNTRNTRAAKRRED
ncbi:DNA-binding transcriptional LysR family regulator [Paenibacillus lupini]|nr:DNA-binding transcriptional LysR family regulator [Paenibacillus lupini]